MRSLMYGVMVMLAGMSPLLAADLPSPSSAGGGATNRAPAYPAELAGRKVGGTVILLLNLTPDGQVTAVEVERSSGEPALDQAAIEAARTWRLAPGSAGRVRVPVSFDPQDLPAGAPRTLSDLSDEEVRLLRRLINMQVPVVALGGDGMLPWNMPDPLAFPSTGIAEQLAQLQRDATRSPDGDGGIQFYELETEHGPTGWAYYPAGQWKFGPALTRQRLVSDGQKSYWLMSGRSEAGARGERQLQQMLKELGRQQPGPPPPPPPPGMDELLQQLREADAAAGL